jgi:hypothetical protein
MGTTRFNENRGSLSTYCKSRGHTKANCKAIKELGSRVHARDWDSAFAKVPKSTHERCTRTLSIVPSDVRCVVIQNEITSSNHSFFMCSLHGLAGAPSVSMADPVLLKHEVLSAWADRGRHQTHVVVISTKHGATRTPHHDVTVEVFGFEDGYENSWSEGKILCEKENCVSVEFSHFVESDDSDQPVVRDVARAITRPLPPESDCAIKWNELKEEDYVDVWIDDCWWEGQVKKILVRALTCEVQLEGSGEIVNASAATIRRGVTYIGGKWCLRKSQ